MKLLADMGVSQTVVKLKNTSPLFVLSRLQSVLENCSEELKAGALAIVSDERYRLRHLPI